MHFGGVARGMSGSRRVSRLAVESVLGSMISNEIKSWKQLFPPPDLSRVVAVGAGEAA